jgi:hypothetical protein
MGPRTILDVVERKKILILLGMEFQSVYPVASCCTGFAIMALTWVKEVKLSLQQAMEIHRVVRC